MSGDRRAIRREFSRPAARSCLPTAPSQLGRCHCPTTTSSRLRRIPTGELFANVTGYYSLALGATPLERTQNAVLTGQTAQQRIGNIEDVFTGGEGTGDVRMTLHADLHETARQALAGRNGSVVMSTSKRELCWRCAATRRRPEPDRRSGLRRRPRRPRTAARGTRQSVLANAYRTASCRARR